ncbi:MAG: glycine--tRNA ligase subunit beta [Candidatus Acidiferrales bacterium]
MKVKDELLLEIGCEEIPAGMIERAALELKALLAKHLVAARLVDEPTVENSIETFGAPRRLVAIARNVRQKQEDITREIVGPPKAIAYDSDGKPTRAALSFSEKQSVPTEKLLVISTPKGEYLAARQSIAGEPARAVLARALPECIRELSWPRSMYWTTADSPRFIRPIRWIVALLDGVVVPFVFADVRSGNRTDGHRFLGKKGIAVTDARDYESKLKKNSVLCRPEARGKKIEAEIRALTSRRSLRVHEDAALLGLVTYLNECPSVISGDFDHAFLALPDEILITVMRGHQKYFAVEKRTGELAPHFLAVINLPSDPKGLVCAGHERVLRARFADARFFWDSDQKVPLDAYLRKLSTVTYERRLGSYGEKVERVRTLARWLAEQWFNRGMTQADVTGSDRAAELAKCDLVTEMVREFPELQGVVGGLYARAQGEPDSISWAVYDHYKPLGMDDPLPRNLTGCTVALADKLDSLAACFGVGIVPTGSSDPFALRRAAMGIVKIILERRLPVSISAMISAAAKALEENPPHIDISAETEERTQAFLLERARFYLREKGGFSYDEINAVFASGADDLCDAADRADAVKSIRYSKDFAPLAASFKRIRNILEKSASKDDKGQVAVNPELLGDGAEVELQLTAQMIRERVGAHKRDRKYKVALQEISKLRPAVDKFFDGVLVMVEDREVRKNRIALLASLLKEFSTIADFSELGCDETK